MRTFGRVPACGCTSQSAPRRSPIPLVGSTCLQGRSLSMVAVQTDDLSPERRGGRVTRRSFLFKAVGVGGASLALMLAQACQSQGGAPPSYGGGSAPAAAPPAT